MKYETNEHYNTVTADDGKLLYTVGEDSITLHKQLIVPKTYTEEYCRQQFAEVSDSAFTGEKGKVFTKLAIRRACRALGLEEKLDTLLASNETFKADWMDAQEIDLADPYTVQALQAFTEEEYNALYDELTKE